MKHSLGVGFRQGIFNLAMAFPLNQGRFSRGHYRGYELLISRRSTLALGTALAAGTAISAFAIEYNERKLSARLDSDLLHVSAPNFSFLTGKPLERLKDGASGRFLLPKVDGLPLAELRHGGRPLDRPFRR